MDEQNLQLQRQLHEQNQKRMDAFEEQQRRQGELLFQIVGNTACLPGMLQRVEEVEDRVDSLESSRDRQKGAMGLIGTIWAGLEGWFHLHK